jgi:multidrug efflux pump subunit AcrB
MNASAKTPGLEFWSEFPTTKWEPMAIAIMAGLLFSTLLTLGVVPVMYALLFRVKSPA